eukprot:g19149.t1
MHWSLTQFMPATNNIGPDNVWERLFAIMTVLVAVCLFSSLVGSITAAVGSFRAVQAEKMKQEQAVVAFFEERKLSAELFDDMREHQRESQKGHAAVADVTTKMSDIRLFRECPESLKLRLSEEVFMPAFDSPGWVQTDILTTGFLWILCRFSLIAVSLKWITAEALGTVVSSWTVLDNLHVRPDVLGQCKVC